MSNLGIFLFISFLWHGLQLALFTWIFKIESPAKLQGEPRQLSVSIISPAPSLGAKVLVARSIPESSKWPEVELIPEAPERIGNLTPLPSKRMVLEEKKIDLSHLEPVVSDTPKDHYGPDVTRNTPLPFHLGGDLQRRKVISSPALPEYPAWALSAAVELSLKISLEVDPNGLPTRVWILEGSGDSHTDLSVLNYVEKLRFEASLSRSVGVMEWAFRLRR